MNPKPVARIRVAFFNGVVIGIFDMFGQTSSRPQLQPVASVELFLYEKRTHAGPRASHCKRDAIPALAGASG
jgi:hypothetical protein